MENREIRRGSTYLLHWYGVPKAHYTDTEGLPPSWDKLKKTAEEARSWLDLIYLIQCGQETDLQTGSKSKFAKSKTSKAPIARWS